MAFLWNISAHFFPQSPHPLLDQNPNPLLDKAVSRFLRELEVKEQTLRDARQQAEAAQEREQLL